MTVCTRSPEQLQGLSANIGRLLCQVVYCRTPASPGSWEHSRITAATSTGGRLHSITRTAARSDGEHLQPLMSSCLLPNTCKPWIVRTFSNKSCNVNRWPSALDHPNSCKIWRRTSAASSVKLFTAEHLQALDRENILDLQLHWPWKVLECTWWTRLTASVNNVSSDDRLHLVSRIVGKSAAGVNVCLIETRGVIWLEMFETLNRLC